MSAAQVVLLDAKRLRAIFNQALFWERVQSGELSLEIVRTGVPRAANRQPPGTRSITARLIDLRGGRRRRVALVHHYELPDGRINNRAQRPDPKWCIVEGVMYRLQV